MNRSRKNVTSFVQSLVDLFLQSRQVRRRRSQQSHIPSMVQVLEPRSLLSGQTITVTTLADSGTGSLRSAIATANGDTGNSDTINFSSSLFPNNTPGTITLTNGALGITNSMTITGPGASLLTISGNSQSEVFEVNDGNANVSQNVTITGMTMENGFANGGGGGGALYNGETLTVSNDEFYHNSSGGGGAIFNTGTLASSSNFYVGNSLNVSYVGGAILNSVFSAGSTMLFTSANDSFQTNSAYEGGAIGFVNSGQMQGAITNDSFSYNSVTGSGSVGGAIFINNVSQGQFIITQSQFFRNSATSSGGAIANEGGTVTSINSTFEGNSASDAGGAIYNSYASPSAGVFIPATFTSLNDTFDSNIAYFEGGAIFNNSDSTLSSTNDTFDGNVTEEGPYGAISNSYGFTYDNNGTLITVPPGNLTTTNDTITNNDGGGIYNYGNWNSLNTIVAGNFASLVSDRTVDVLNSADGTNGTGTIQVSYTLIGDPNSAGGITATNGNVVGAALNTIFLTNNGRPVFAYNGGPTYTIALIASSPAVNAGGALTTLSAAVTNTSTTTLTVNNSTYIAVGDTLRVDNELMQVTAVNGTRVTVARGTLGTQAGTHNVNAAVVLATDQRGVIRSGVDMGSYAQNAAPSLPGGAGVTKSIVSSSGVVYDLSTEGKLYSWAGPGVTWTQLDSGLTSVAIAGNGDVVDLHSDGTLWEQTVFGSSNTLMGSPNPWIQLDGSVVSFAIAGTGNVVDLHGGGGVFEFMAYRNASSYQQVDMNVTSIAIAGNGDVVDLHTDGRLWEQTVFGSNNTLLSSPNQWIQLDGGVARIGVDVGGSVLDLHGGGGLYEFTSYRSATSYVQIDSGVASFAIDGTSGVVDLHSDGKLFERVVAIGFVQIDVGVKSFVIAGNGDVVDLHNGSGVYEFTRYGDPSSYMAIDGGVTTLAVAGNGDLVVLHSNGTLSETTAFRSTTSFMQLDSNVTSFAIAGNGDVVELRSNALYESTAYRSRPSMQIDGGVNIFQIASNGLVEDQHFSGLMYIQTSYRSQVSQQISQFQ